MTARLRTTPTPTPWTVTGAVNVTATSIDVSDTGGNADAAGSGVAVGAIIGINVVGGWGTTAEIARDISGTSVTLDAISKTSASTMGKASAEGNSSSSGGNADSTTANKSGQQAPNHENPKQPRDRLRFRPPSSNSTGTGAASSQAGSQAGDSQSGGVDIAAAISVDWVTTTNTASIGSDAVVTGRTGAVAVNAEDATSANAFGMGTAIDPSASTSVGAALGLNVENVTNTAVVHSGAPGHGRRDHRVGLPPGQRRQQLHRLGNRRRRRQV